MQEIIWQLRKALPPIFLGSSIDELTGGAVHWRTIQNKRSRREIPNECFIRTATKNIIVVRDRFLDWWVSTLRPACQTSTRCTTQPPDRGQDRISETRPRNETAVE
jgi:hypothetical protein